MLGHPANSRPLRMDILKLTTCHRDSMSAPHTTFGMKTSHRGNIAHKLECMNDLNTWDDLI